MDKLIQYIDTMMKGKPFGLYLYGSSAFSLSLSRDIDAVVMTTQNENVVHTSFVLSTKTKRRTCNLYLVPESVYLEDLRLVRYGGYYTHKFSLSFRLLSTEGRYLDAPFLFWKQQQLLFESKLRKGLEPDQLMRFVHLRILEFNQTFVRPLARFLSQPKEKKELRRYLTDNVLNAPLTTGYPYPESFQVQVKDNLEKAFFQFWLEYNKHKHSGSMWGPKTFLKIRRSCERIDLSVVQDYLKG